ncbi:MAG: hypothetical protein KAZ70_00325, partial [Actinomyces sp.]|nr:hypothetical protein [Actinomyces sp.]
LQERIQTLDISQQARTQALEASLRGEIAEFRMDTKAELRTINERIDATNARIDRLSDSLRVPAAS